MENKKLTGYPLIDKPWLKYYSEASEMAKLLAKNEDIFAGISSGAAMATVLKLTKKSSGSIVTVFLDRWYRYFSAGLYI